MFYPPMNIATRDRSKPSVFLAGTIDQGNSEDWQSELAKSLEGKYNVFNPRRPDWDSSWSNNFHSPHFFQQVTWEMDAIEQANIVIFYFAYKSESLISLLEFGYVLGIKKHCLCVCHPDFYRRGNIEVMCHRKNIPLYYSLDSMLDNRFFFFEWRIDIMDSLIDKIVSFGGFYYIIKKSIQLEADMIELDCFIIGSNRESLEPIHLVVGSPKKLKCNLDIQTLDISSLNENAKFYYDLFKE